MWKEYSDDFIKNNRSSSLSIRISAFISALLLSLLCGLFYNLWKYDVERIELEHGSWQSRIIGEFSPEAAESIKNFAHVKDAVVNVKESSGTETAIDIYFDDYGAVFSDTPRIAEQAGIPPEKVVYNYEPDPGRRGYSAAAGFPDVYPDNGASVVIAGCGNT